MATFFSIIPPPKGSDGALSVPLIPDIESLMTFASGNIGIAETMKKNFLFKSMAPVKMTDQSASAFVGVGGFSTPRKLDSYSKPNGRFSVPETDFNLDPKNDKSGLKAIEMTTLKAIFETQKPYMDLVPSMIRTLAKLEDVAAKTLASTGKSRKPKRNEKSLTYKLNASQEELNQMQNFSKKKANPFKDKTAEDKMNGVDLLADLVDSKMTDAVEAFMAGDFSQFEWEILSVEYSTGFYIEGVDYKTIYRNIIDPRIILDGNNGEAEDEIKEDDKPPTIIIAYFDKWGRPKAPPTQWLNRIYGEGHVGPGRTKWYGEWEQLRDNDYPRYTTFLREYINDRLYKKTGSTDPELQNEVYDYIEPKINAREFVQKANENCFMTRITKFGEEGLELGNDSQTEVSRVTNGRQRMYLPKKVNYKGKNVIIDPEAEYDLQIVKIVPTKNVWYNGQRDRYNQNLKKTTPLVGNYRGTDVRDTLSKSEYDKVGYNIHKPTAGQPRRVQIAYKYLWDGADTEWPNTANWDFEEDYAIEGILRESPLKQEENKLAGNTEGTGSSGSPWYRFPDTFTAVKDFIDILVGIATQTIPDITAVLKLFGKPHELIFDTIFEKLEENFDSFSKNLMGKYSTLSSFDNKFDKADYIKRDPDLKKFVALDEDLNHRFVLDGFSGFELLGFAFGINVLNFIPKLVMNQSANPSSKNAQKKSVNGNDLPTSPRNNVYGNTNPNGSGGGSTNTGDGDPVNANVRNLQDDGTYKWETVSVEYSTGNFIQGTDYEYIYISQDVERLLAKGDDLFELASNSDNDVDSAVEGLSYYNMAREKDPNNNGIQNKIDQLKAKFKLGIQMILQFLINFVSFPIKLVTCLLEEILGFFKEMATVVKIPSVLEEFLSFGWVMKYVKPSGILDLIGLKFNPEQLYKWINEAKTGTVDPNKLFDLSAIVGAPFLFKFPKVNADQLNIMKTMPLQMMSSVFKLVEMLIEGILCFIWNILNIDAIIPCPPFKLSRFAAANLPPEDLQAILNGDASMLNVDPNTGENTGNGNGVPYKLVYDIKLDDGTVIKELNYAELQQFMTDNQEFNYEVTF